jgi:hypothetical protein
LLSSPNVSLSTLFTKSGSEDVGAEGVEDEIASSDAE